MTLKLLGLYAAVVTTLGAMVFLLTGVHISPAAPVVGAVGSTDFQQSQYSFQGVDYDQENIPLTGTSSIPAFIVPTFIHGGGTSTILSMSLTLTGNGMGAQTIDISTTSSRFAASSTPGLVVAASIAAAVKFPLMWDANSTTTNPKYIGTNGITGLSDIILPPGVGVQLRIATATPGVFTTYLQGQLHVLFQRI